MLHNPFHASDRLITGLTVSAEAVQPGDVTFFNISVETGSDMQVHITLGDTFILEVNDMLCFYV